MLLRDEILSVLTTAFDEAARGGDPIRMGDIADRIVKAITDGREIDDATITARVDSGPGPAATKVTVPRARTTRSEAVKPETVKQETTKPRKRPSVPAANFSGDQ